jgi:hypothetical protein
LRPIYRFHRTDLVESPSARKSTEGNHPKQKKNLYLTTKTSNASISRSTINAMSLRLEPSKGDDQNYSKGVIEYLEIIVEPSNSMTLGTNQESKSLRNKHRVLTNLLEKL